jgi:hypothetical protein
MTTDSVAWDIREELAPRRPPCSPDCTPIEQACSKIKALAPARTGARTHDALQEAVRLATAAITRADAVARFAHAGYTLPAQGT